MVCPVFAVIIQLPLPGHMLFPVLFPGTEHKVMNTYGIFTLSSGAGISLIR